MFCRFCLLGWRRGRWRFFGGDGIYPRLFNVAVLFVAGFVCWKLIGSEICGI